MVDPVRRPNRKKSEGQGASGPTTRKLSRNARDDRQRAARSTSEAINKATRALHDGKSVFELIRTVSDANSRLEARYREGLYVNLTALYTAAAFMRDDSDAWEEFCLDDSWTHERRKPHSDNPGDALRCVLRLSLSGTKGAVNDKSSKYFTALSDSWECYREPEEVRKLLEEHGIEGLIDKYRRKPERNTTGDEEDGVAGETAERHRDNRARTSVPSKVTSKAKPTARGSALGVTAIQDAPTCRSAKVRKAQLPLAVKWPTGRYSGTAKVTETDGQRFISLKMHRV